MFLFSPCRGLRPYGSRLDFCKIGLHLVLGLIWCASTPVAQAQRYPVSDIPPNLLPNASAVYRNHETTFRVLSLDEAELTTVHAVTILNAVGDHEATWRDYESSFVKVKSLEGKLYDAKGETLRSSKKSDIKDYGGFADYEFSDVRNKILDLSSNQYPYTVEFKVKKTLKGFFSIPPFEVQPLGVSVERASCSLIVPKDYGFRWKGVHTNVQPTTAPDKDEVVWTWAFGQLAARPDEMYTPKDMDVGVLIAPNQVSIEKRVGNFEDWNHIGQFFYDLNKGRTELSEAMRTQALALTAQATTRRDKIEALYRHLQQTCRYISIQIGLGGWQTLDAQFVETKKYGDCKALSNYMKALLAAVDIPSYHAVIYAGDEGAPPLHDDVPIPAFNHMILYVPDEDLWLECTSRTNPVGHLGDFTSNRQALLLTPEGGRLVRTPSPSAQDNLESAHITLDVDAEGQATIQTRFLAMGERHDYYRHLNTKERKDIEKAVAQEVGVSVISFKKLEIAAAPDTAQAVLRYDLSTGSYGTRSGKRLFVPLLKLHPFRRSLPMDDERKADLVMRTTYAYADTIVMRIPLGHTLESIPNSKTLESEFGRYALSFQKGDSLLTVVRHFSLPPVSVPASRYQAARQFYLDMGKLDMAQAVLVRE